MSDGNRRDDAASDHLVGQFAGRPVRHGPARFLGRFAGHRDDPRDLIGRERAAATGPGKSPSASAMAPPMASMVIAPVRPTIRSTKPSKRRCPIAAPIAAATSPRRTRSISSFRKRSPSGPSAGDSAFTRETAAVAVGVSVADILSRLLMRLVPPPARSALMLRPRSSISTSTAACRTAKSATSLNGPMAST